MIPDQKTFVHGRWPAQHFCMLAVTETYEQHGDKHCPEGGAKKCLFAHPDQLLLAMCTDRDEAVRREAFIKSGS